MLEALKDFCDELRQLQPLVAVLEAGQKLDDKLAAAVLGHLPILCFLLDLVGADALCEAQTVKVCRAAAEGGYLRCLAYAMSRDVGGIVMALIQAVLQLEEVAWSA